LSASDEFCDNASLLRKGRRESTTQISVEEDKGSNRECRDKAMIAFQSLVLLALFYVVNVVISVFNKWEFNGPLMCPMYVTMTHQLICFVGSLLLVCTPYFKFKRLSGKEFWKVMCIPLFFVSNIGLNNLSLLYTTLVLNQLVRAFCPVMVTITAFFIENKRTSFGSTLSISMLVFGIILGVCASPDFDIMGVTICLFSVLGNAMQTTIIAYTMTMKLDPVNLVLYTALPNSLILLPGMFIMGEDKVLLNHIEESGFSYIMALTMIGGIIAFAYNLILITFIQQTSSIYSSVAGSFKIVPIMFFSFLFFHQKISALGFFGMCVACVAFGFNSWFMFKEKDEARRKKILETQNSYHPVKPQKIV
jgi:drug/metabolite transporter (DMT)-like permease